MCGIAGILRFHPPSAGTPPPPWESIPEQWLDILDTYVQHRGPDGAGRFRDRATDAHGAVVDVALVHRRLAIIDLADGHQPMVSLARGKGVVRTPRHTLGPGLGLYAPGEHTHLRSATVRPAASPSTIAVVFNGCVYNHRELRAELEAAGHVFSTDHSDTEVLAHGWREWGADLGEHIDAMAAALIWDARSATLTALRDRFGEKPCYVAMDAATRTYIFSGNFAGAYQLMRLLNPDTKLDQDGVARWIAFGYHAIRTPSLAVSQVPHASTITFPLTKEISPEDLAERQVTRSTTGELRRSLRPAWSTESAVEELDARLDAAVAGRLEADVPLACLLSAGVDSPLVALKARRHAPSLTTICVRMPDARYDESAEAERLAGIIGSTHLTIDAAPHAAEDLIVLIQTLGLPFGDSSLLPTFWACVAARDHAKVLLSGDGGDELFFGYERYRAAKWLPWCDSMMLRPLLRLFAGGHPKSRTAKLNRLLRAAAGDQYPDLLAIFDSIDRKELIGRRARSFYLAGSTVASAHQAQRYDLIHHFPGDLLRKTDTASMIAGVELRAPLLARSLADHTLALNPLQLMPGGKLKGLLRQVARRYFPAEIVDRPKMGFAIPIGEWFRTNHAQMRDLLFDHLHSAEPFGPPSLGIELNMRFIHRMLKEHDDAGEKSLFPWKGRDHSQRLYMLLVLSIWAKWLGSLGRVE